VLFARGARDEWLTQAKFDRDVSSLTARGAPLTQLVYEGAHEWNTEVSGAIGDFLKSVTS
jgi:predicted esterase